MNTKLHLSEIIDPAIRVRLKGIATLIKKIGGVADLEQRLLTWINGDDLGTWILNNYKHYGVYYIKLTKVFANPNNRKTSLWYDVYNLFTDEKVFSVSDQVFNPQHNPESDPLASSGFQWFQWNPAYTKGTLGSYFSQQNEFNYPVLFVRPAEQFNNITITPGTGGNITTLPGSNQTQPQQQTQQPQQSNQVSNALGGLTGLFDNPLYLLAGAAILFLVMRK